MTLAPAQIRTAKTQLPRRLAGLGLWLDASVRSSLAINGSGVSEWRDISGRGRHFVQPTAASQPDGESRTYNGLRVVDFDGTRFLAGNAATLELLRDAAGVTVLIVCKADSRSAGNNAANNRRFLSWQTGTNDNARLAFQVRPTSLGGTEARTRRTDAQVDPSTVAYEAGAATLDANVFSLVFDYGSAAMQLFAGGVLSAVGTIDAPGQLPDTASTSATLGGYLQSPLIQSLDGFIGELIVYRRVLSGVERRRLESYLIDKWNPQPEPPVPLPAGVSLWKAEISESTYHWSV